MERPDKTSSLPELPPGFSLQDGELHCEGTAIADLADRFGTPLYVYSRAAIEERVAAVRAAFGPRARVHYAVKANPNLHLLRLLAELGTGFDLVSGGELLRLQAAGCSARDAVFAGVAKQAWEIEAALRADIRLFNVESPHELALLEEAARRLDRRARVAVRLNPAVEAHTHDYISTGRRRDKFGLDMDAAAAAVERIAASPRLELVGYHVHLGSQLRRVEPWLEAFEAVTRFCDEVPARGEGVRYYDLGGGFGVSYGDPGGLFDVGALATALLPRLAARGWTPVLEPGRYLVADAGALVTRVLGEKATAGGGFVLVDAAMNDLLRPSLYRAHHPVLAVRPRPGPLRTVDVVGPVCESGDFLAKERELPPQHPGDLLCVLSAGAYGMSMASTYNSRLRPAEVLVEGRGARAIRRRDRFDELWAAELEADAAP